ncbi:MAG TPA: DUF5671 domain-containing protein [Candidatus Paceibacterota bacterium]|nr:DUF5671 domain-containing protein [Candidatus Paceibacterota bacterium]
MNTPKNFFLQFGIIVSLYASVVSFLTFVFELIDHLLPQASTNYYYYDYMYLNDGIRYSISVLIVMFPLFIWLSRYYRKTLASTPELSESKLRKWLLYFTLFLAGLAIAIDVIVLINTFLRGEVLALSFVLKVLSVLIVAIGIFYFYLKDIKGHWEENPKKVKSIASVVSAAVLVSVIGGIIIIGSPSHQRDIRNDNTRVQNLETIQYEVVEYYQEKGKLPAKLSDVIDSIRGNNIPKDPETKADYTYEVTGPLTFKLCAAFKTDTEVQKQKTDASRAYLPYPNEHWDHPVGEKCFDRKIDTDRYPIRKLQS